MSKADGDHYRQKAKRELEARGHKVTDTDSGFRVVRSDGSEVAVRVAYRRKQRTVPVVPGKISRLPDGSYDTAEVFEKLLPGGFTIGYVIDDVYVVPHDDLIPLFDQWVGHRRGNEHTFELNPTSAGEVGLDLNHYLNAWELLSKT